MTAIRFNRYTAAEYRLLDTRELGALQKRMVAFEISCPNWIHLAMTCVVCSEETQRFILSTQYI